MPRSYEWSIFSSYAIRVDVRDETALDDLRN